MPFERRSSSGDNTRLRVALFVDMHDGQGLRFAGNVTSPKIRLLIQTGDTFRPVCKILLPRNDFSFAIVPYSVRGTYFYHSTAFEPSELQKEIPCTEPSHFESVPKMQFHDSLPGSSTGQVHISAGKTRVGIVPIPPLAEWTGDHIATVDVDSFCALPIHARSLKRKGDDLDQPLRFAEGIEAGRFVFCVNAQRPVFAHPCFLTLRAWNNHKEIFLGIAPKEQPPRAEHTGGGIVVIGGWDPNISKQPLNLLTLRAV